MNFKVNNADLREATHDMAINALRQTPSSVRLKVLRDESQFKDEGKIQELVICIVCPSISKSSRDRKWRILKSSEN